MKVLSFFSCLGLATGLLFYTGDARAGQTVPVKEKITSRPAMNTDPVPAGQKYNFHEASSLSGIALRPDRSTGNILLLFDQRLTEPGTLLVKNTAGKVLYTNVLQPEKERRTHTMNIGKLTPGIYSIEVKTAETTFWKKVRVRK